MDDPGPTCPRWSSREFTLTPRPTQVGWTLDPDHTRPEPEGRAGTSPRRPEFHPPGAGREIAGGGPGGERRRPLFSDVDQYLMHGDPSEALMDGAVS